MLSVPLVSGAVLRLRAQFKRDAKKLQQPPKASILRCFLGVQPLPIFHAMAHASRLAMLMLDKLLASNHEKTIVLYCFLNSYVIAHVRFSRVLLSFLHVTDE
jgi:hypothetical protein